MSAGLAPGACRSPDSRRNSAFAPSNAGVRDVADHVTSRWGIWVLISLRSNDLRFYELRDSIQGISEKMLAQTLRALVKDGLVRREVEPTTPPQVTYGLTEFGQEIGEPLTDLFNRITQRLPPRSPG
ncbi:transcriptional regulator [Streptomyces lydicus]|uniref:Transcriptional regulator n=1 Tax=Streptomyces lydicus TaxID=47763 RepID=A0A3Q9KGF0_9ACTN|nr:transcriptional regulator [Streptomyces lydicus]